MSKYIKAEDILSLAEKGVLISNSNYKKVCKAIESLPTIELKTGRPTGKWIDRESCQVDEDAYDVAICSECNKEITIDPLYDNYCPNCGADMREEQNNE